jgi:trimeric autotransporter adhesin
MLCWICEVPFFACGQRCAYHGGLTVTFQPRQNTWSQQVYVKASNTGEGDWFGWWVSLSGDTLAVGAPFESSAARGVNDNDKQDDDSKPAAGAVYVFVRKRATWTQQAYLKASNTDENDFFGWSVSLSGDTLAVGAPGEASAATGVNGDQNNNLASFAGAVYVFRN